MPQEVIFKVSRQEEAAWQYSQVMERILLSCEATGEVSRARPSHGGGSGHYIAVITGPGISWTIN